MGVVFIPDKSKKNEKIYVSFSFKVRRLMKTERITVHNLTELFYNCYLLITNLTRSKSQVFIRWHYPRWFLTTWHWDLRWENLFWMFFVIKKCPVVWSEIEFHLLKSHRLFQITGYFGVLLFLHQSINTFLWINESNGMPFYLIILLLTKIWKNCTESLNFYFNKMSLHW